MIKNQDRMQSHTMELPRLIEIGEKNIGDFGKFLNSLNKPKKVSLISGINVQKVLRKKIEKSLKFWLEIPSTKQMFENGQFRNVAESKRNLNQFFKPKLKQIFFLLNRLPGSGDVRPSPSAPESPWR